MKCINYIEEVPDTNNIVENMEIDDFLNQFLTSTEKYIVIHHALWNESLLVIKEALKLGNVDVYKMYKKAIKKLEKGVVK